MPLMEATPGAWAYWRGSFRKLKTRMRVRCRLRGHKVMLTAFYFEGQDWKVHLSFCGRCHMPLDMDAKRN